MPSTQAFVYLRKAKLLVEHDVGYSRDSTGRIVQVFDKTPVRRCGSNGMLCNFRDRWDVILKR